MPSAGRIALIDTEEGSASVSNRIASGAVELFPAPNFDAAEKAFIAISKRVDEFDTIVVDTMTTLAGTTIQDLALRGGSRSDLWSKREAMGASQQQWGQMSSLLILFTRNLYDMGNRSKRIVLVCHEGSRDDPYEGIEMHAPDLNKMLLKDLYGMCDAIVRLGKLPQKAKIGDVECAPGTRILRLQDSPKYMAKGRDVIESPRPELLANPTMSSFLAVCNPSPRKIVLYGSPGSGKTVLACSE